MAAPDTRTAADDATDALTALDAAMRELANWRAHLERARINPAPGVVMQARRCAGVVRGEVDRAWSLTDAAASRTGRQHNEAGQLRSVS